jgi:hypothetical protein
MGIFFCEKRTLPTFQSRAQAFDYLFADLVDKGEDMMTAAEQANKFADIISLNKGLPAALPPPQNSIEKAVGYVKQILVLKQENPEVWDLVAGAAGGLISGLTLLASRNSPPAPPSVEREEKINFDELE